MEPFHSKITKELHRLQEHDTKAASLLGELRRAIQPGARNGGYVVTDSDTIEVKGRHICAFSAVEGKLGIYGRDGTLCAEPADIDEATTKLAELVAAELYRDNDDHDDDDD